MNTVIGRKTSSFILFHMIVDIFMGKIE